MNKEFVLGLTGLAILGLGAGVSVNTVSAEEISSDVVLDGDVDYEYLVTDGGTLTISTEGEIGEVIVEAGGSLVVNSPVSIENLYIYPGASVTLNACIVLNMIIEYGEGYNVENISFGEKAEVFSTFVNFVIPAGSESGEIALPSVSNLFYEDGCYYGAWTEDDKCLGTFSEEDFTPATSYTYTSTNEDVELIAGGADTTYNAIAFVTSVNNPEYGTVSESVMYSTKEGFDKTISVTFAPNEGYEVARVKVNGNEVPTASPYTFLPSEMYGKQTFHVEFVETRKAEFTITTSASEGGTITESVTLEEGSKADIIISANSGFEISSLMVNGSNVSIASGLTSYTYTIDAVSENVSILASFKLKQYTISMYAGLGGSISGSGTVNHGDNAEITISPSEGYKIKSIVVDGNPVAVQSTTYKIESVTENHSVQVEFEKLTYTVTTSEGSNGAITAPASVEYGGNIDVLITPDSGYLISSVKVNGENIEFSLDANGVAVITLFSVKANQTVSATFTPAIFSINVQTDLGVTADYESSVNYSSSTEILLSVSKGYKITGITQNGEDLDADAVAEIINDGKIGFNNICANVNISIQAEKIVYSIIYNLNGGVNSKDNPETFTISNLGEKILAPSKVGYRFKGWKIGDKMVSTFTLSEENLENITLTAVWEEVNLQSGLGAGKTMGILTGGAVLSGGVALGAILALKKKKWFD